MKKQTHLFAWLLFGVVLMFAACGEKSEEDVVGKLDQTLEEIGGYKTSAKMTMKTGQDKQVYGIDVWFKKEDFYRVHLNHPEDEKGSQVILKNEEGVFVLTPSLDKSFKFQTDWPDNSSQPYLLQSLIKDIKEDEEAEFEATEDHYVFKTKTNYKSNNNLPFQEIYLDKKTYTPVKVNVLDRDHQPLVEVDFVEFDLDPTFEADDFSVDDDTVQEEEDSDATAPGEEKIDEPLSILYPLNTAGAQLDEKKTVELESGERAILTFTGEKNFTLVQEKTDSKALPTMAHAEETVEDLVHLGFAVGALSENKIEWNYNGVDFILASEDLTKQELIEVAQSVIGKEAK